MMECTQHVRSHFITLTYAPEHLPTECREVCACRVAPTLAPRDLQEWLKRLRFALAPARVRYYAVGEYGDKTWRPHYHIALFGLPVDLALGKHVDCKCVICQTWSLGLVHVGEVRMESAAYIAAYTVKKLTTVTDPRLGGRHPEFARMSLRPGIGHGAMKSFAEALLDKTTGEIRLRDFDVPAVARSNGKLWPLGRYLRRVVRVASLGVETASGPANESRCAGLLAEAAGFASVKQWLDSREKGRDSRRFRAESMDRLNRQKKGIGL